jgi:hypothetical protein
MARAKRVGLTGCWSSMLKNVGVSKMNELKGFFLSQNLMVVLPFLTAAYPSRSLKNMIDSSALV